MSTLIEDSYEEFLLHGKYLERSELIRRLNMMGVMLDNLRDLSKENLVEYYNNEILNFQRRIKIKSIIETDIVDRPEKNLNRKRERNSNSNTKGADNSLLSPSVNKAHFQRNLRSGATSSNRKNFEPRRSSRKKATPQFNKDSNSKNVQKKSFPQLLDIIHNNHNNQKTSRIRNQDTREELNEKIKYINNISFSKEVGAVSKISDMSSNPQISNKPTNRVINYYDLDTIEENLNNFSTKQLSSEKGKNSIRVVDNDNKIQTSNSSFSQNKKITKDYINKESPNKTQKINKQYSKLISKTSPDVELKENMENEDYFNTMQVDSVQFEENPFQSLSRTIKSSVSLNTREKNQSGLERKNSEISARSRDTTQDFKKPPGFDFSSGIRQKSLPGSSKNIQEILRNVEIRSPRPVISTNEINSVNNQIRGISGSVRSLRSITVSIREASPVSDFTEKTFKEKFMESISLSSLINKIKSTDLNVLLPGILVVSGSLYLIFYVSSNVGNTNFKPLMEFAPEIMLVTSVIILFFIVFIFSKNISEKRYFKKLANEDYQKIIQLLENNYSTEEEPLGIFESSFVKSASIAHNMTEERYRANVLPGLDEVVNQNKQLQIKEMVIQDQSHKIWDFIRQQE
jgi:hypothetical protein